jgi:hypothetical protein
MRSYCFVAVAILILTPFAAMSGDLHAEVYTWDPGCEYRMTTNHFDLAPRESVEITLDLTGCGPEKLGGLLFTGYKTKKRSSVALAERDNIRLILVDNFTNVEVVSDGGSLYSDVPSPTSCTLIAENLNRNKTLTVRLISRSGL